MRRPRTRRSSCSGCCLRPREGRRRCAKPPEWDLADWVLSRFSPDDQKLMDAAFARAADAAECFLSHGIEEAMNVFNRKA